MPLCICINDHSLLETKAGKFLGLLIDSKLCWKAHVDHVCSKFVSGLFAFRKVNKDGFDFETGFGPKCLVLSCISNNLYVLSWINKFK